MENKYKVRTIICKQCRIKATKRQPKGRKFCTIKCYRNYCKRFSPKKKNGQIKNCLYCKKSFYVPKCFLNRKYCSPYCYHGHYNQYIKISCLKCKKEIVIKRTPYNITHLPKYCSSKCCNRSKHIIEHHIDLNKKNNKKSNKIRMTNSQHGRIHVIAYRYLVEIGEIKNYIKWFKRKYLKKPRKKMNKESMVVVGGKL